MTDPEHGSDETPWEPPLAGGEAEQVLAALDRLRWTFRWKADGLDAAGLSQRIGASTLTLGRLLKHLAAVEDDWFHRKLAGDPMPAAWDGNGWDDAVARCRARFGAAIADGGLGREAHLSTPDGEHASVRRLLFDLIEEYGRHTGHADLLREAVDGRVGEDPPARWRPGGGG